MLLDTSKLAWRNLGRNIRRSIVTGAALSFGICLCVATYGLVDGLNAQMVHALTRFDIGHVQIHTPAYTKRRVIDRRIDKPAKLVEATLRMKHVRGSAARVYTFSLVSHQGKSSGVELVGIDPKNEIRVTELHLRIKEGRYLDKKPTPWPRGRKLNADERRQDNALTAAAEQQAMAEIDDLDSLDEVADAASNVDHATRPSVSDDARHQTSMLARAVSPSPERPPQVILGVDLARLLDVTVGDKLYISTLAVDGQSEASFVQLVGLFETGTQLHDRNRIYLHIDALRRMTHLGATAHEIALSLDSIEHAEAVAVALAGGLPIAGGDTKRLKVRTWKEVRPDIEQMLMLNDVSTTIMVFIIFMVATLGVVNTMLMSVFERTRELGLLKAIGMSAGQLVTLVLIETLFLVLSASAIGTALGLCLDAYMVRYGIDLSHYTEGFSMAGIGISPVIYGVITLRGVVVPTAVLSISCLLASLYPALRAAHMQPAIGMRQT